MPFVLQALPILILPILLAVGYVTGMHIPNVYYPASPLLFKVRQRAGAPDIVSNEANSDATHANGNGSQNHFPRKKVESMSIKTFLESRVPSLYKGYRPSWWLPSGHLQTFYVVSGDFTKTDQLLYERTLLRTPDGGTLGLDMTPTTEQNPDLPDDTPIVVVQHGLTGGSYESYVRSILAHSCAPKSQGGLGYRGIVINFRGCANVPVTSWQFYSAGHTEDLRCGLLFISHKFPKAPLIGLGFSLGANVMTRYLGEEKEWSRLQAGIVLACPWDVVKNSIRLETEFIPKTLYAPALGGNLMALIRGHVGTLQKLPPDDRLAPQMDNILSLKNPTLKQVDHALTRFCGGSSPPFPFKSADEYYVWASSHRHVTSIRVPFLAINAADDPIVGFSPTEETAHGQTCALAVTPSGGHLGWFRGGSPIGSGGPPDRWVREPVLEFLRAAAEDYVPDSRYGPPKDGRDRVERDGFVLERGKDLIGYKVVSTGQIIHGGESTPAHKLKTQGL
ncbi:Alpha/Beta hydrolase protein [Cantharellus anzutake]|uniref:Alpha/Beta hydrolase protein n=1 Tax=Cantharellus anzutake TaxID=1750568 RepID=UPI0019038094|nr:Alpha/Beta hydrolase protein [Cantharellus anzutake]KAF8341528.1 Alpha/Beta hydrolase protein [Cantharellus anzutake]